MLKVGTHSAAIDSAVISGIAKAAHNRNIDFSFLMAQAARESNFNPAAKASGSSARGLYQFIEQTWLEVFKTHASELGQGDLSALSDKIQVDDKGRYYVKDAQTRKQILALRQDPEISSFLAAAHAEDNQKALDATLDREIKPTDLYMAHLLGPAGAQHFLEEMQKNGRQSAADLFPVEAASNPGLFYDKFGKAKALHQIYASLDKGIHTDMQQYAALTPAISAPQVPKTPEADPVSLPGQSEVASLDARIWTQLHARQPDNRRVLQALELANAPYLS